MNELLVVGFEGNHRAREVLDTLLELKTAWAIELDLEDAVAVYRTKAGRLHVDSTMHPTVRQGTTLGGVIGGLIGALLGATEGRSSAPRCRQPRRSGCSRY